MPQVQHLQIELKEVIGEARSIGNEQEETRARLRDLVRRRQDVEKRGELVRRRVESHLRGTFGFTNAQLIKFGIKPRQVVIRRKKAKSPQATQPPEAETPKPPATP